MKQLALSLHFYVPSAYRQVPKLLCCLILRLSESACLKYQLHPVFYLEFCIHLKLQQQIGLQKIGHV
ncbi:hypothetical protein HPB48_017501 [Haemaphysalis longicornis]|uniref:Uncharacterized protein n=1 Tax=Haemaphysalis longicornis TaxID=44386 RepID=A0A9J6GAV8_HAELO|nr:hypothetical protein HPB48_017501 [Haemaphysalis longicornis]